jgi:hypothetical protein
MASVSRAYATDFYRLRLRLARRYYDPRCPVTFVAFQVL